MEFSDIFVRLGIALGLGLLVGLQREHSHGKLAGVRTVPLITILGSVSALLAGSLGGWIVAAGFVALALIVFAGIRIEADTGKPDPGLTTEAAILLMYGVGAYTMVGDRAVAVAIGAGVAVLLQFKGQLHGFVAKLGEDDLKAFMTFALISLVILPSLPNRSFGPYDVLNPQQIWWMVVLIVGINLSGYIAYKLLGHQAGTLLSGVLGGLVSSTATTVSYSRRTASEPEQSPFAAIVILIASLIVFVRLIVEVAVVSPGFVRSVAPRLAIMGALFVIFAAYLWLRGARSESELPDIKNPTEVGSALFFGLVYAVVLFAVAAARDWFGEGGLYAVAGISGLTDVDAITLSTARLVELGRLDASNGSRVILVAAMSNLVFKGGVVLALGDNGLRKLVIPFYAVSLVVGITLVVFDFGL